MKDIWKEKSNKSWAENKLCENRDGQKALKKKKDHKELDKSKSPTNINN